MPHYQGPTRMTLEDLKSGYGSLTDGPGEHNEWAKGLTKGTGSLPSGPGGPNERPMRA